MIRQKDIRAFINGGMDLDSDERLVKPENYRECYNSIVNVSEGSNVGCLENIKGTSSIFSLSQNSAFMLPTGTHIAIGAVEDIENNAVIYFLCDTTASNNHCIMRYFLDSKKVEWILYAQSLLNFQLTYKIQGNVIGDLLYWTDGYEDISDPFSDYNPPRKINIVKATAMTNTYDATVAYYKGQIVQYASKAYRRTTSGAVTGQQPDTATTYWALANVGVYSALTERIMDRIKYPPLNAPTVSPEDDGESRETCRLRGKVFQFAYLYIYDDNERSVLSSISNIPNEFFDNTELFDGSYINSDLEQNVIEITVDTSAREVVTLELYVRDGNNGVWQLFHRIHKYNEDGDVLVASDLDYVYSFYNNTILEPVDQADIGRLYDSVPQISSLETIIEKNRIIDADYTEGFDQVDVDVVLARDSSYVGVGLGFEQTSSWGVGNYILWDGGAYAVEYTCITVDISDITQYRENSMWAIHMWESNNINTEGGFTGLFMSRQGDFPQGILSSWVDQIRAQGYTTYPVFCLTNVPAPFTQTGNPVGLGTLDGYKIAFAVNVVGEYWLGIGDVDTTHIAAGGIRKRRSFKTRSWHQLGIQYFDRGGRLSAVNANETSRIYIEPFTENCMSVAYLKWQINHTPPKSATHYQFVSSLGETVSYFEYFRVNTIAESGIDPVTKVGINSLVVTVNDDINVMNETFSRSVVAPYSWESGDRLRFAFFKEDTGTWDYEYYNTELDFEIINAGYPDTDIAGENYGYKKDRAGDDVLDEDGNKVSNPFVLQVYIPDFNREAYPSLGDLSKINSGLYKVYVEIYRPARQSQDKVYYSIGEKYEIIDPHTSARAHQGGTGTLGYEISWQQDQYEGGSTQPARGYLYEGDVWVRARFTGDLADTTPFPIESRSYSDYFESSSIDIGHPNIENRNMYRQRYKSRLLYSGKYVQDTLVNDLSKVDSTDSITLGERYGTINYIQENGFTLKVLQRYKPTSLYIGREGLKQANLDGQDIVATTDFVLGQPIVSELDYGTTFTEGCTKYLRNIYFYDAYNGAIVRDAPNGLFPISDYGIKDWLRDKSQGFIANGIDNISVYSAYDEKFNLVFFSFIDDTVDSSENVTIAFHEPTNKWISFYNFLPDFYGSLGSVLTSWSGETLWLHNDGTRMNFYGVQYSQSVKVVANKDPLKVKTFKSIVVDSNKVWNAGTNGDITIAANGSMTRGASSKIPEAWFELREGKYYAHFGRNMLSSSSTLADSDLIEGDELRGSSMAVTLRNSSTDETKLFGVIIDSAYSPKSGV